MKYDREQIINLRMAMIKYGIKDSSIKTITESLIKYPKMVSVVTRLDEIKYKYVTREYVSTGHGAFGEPEGYTNTYVNGVSLENKGNMIFLNELEEPIYSSRFNLENMINLTKEKHNESFTL